MTVASSKQKRSHVLMELPVLDRSLGRNEPRHQRPARMGMLAQRTLKPHQIKIVRMRRVVQRMEKAKSPTGKSLVVESVTMPRVLLLLLVPMVTQLLHRPSQQRLLRNQTHGNQVWTTPSRRRWQIVKLL
jgi:hypothetical protein